MGKPYITNNYGEWVIKGEFDLTAAGAILASRGDALVFTRTGVGTYTVRVINETFIEVLSRRADVNRATATAGTANISAIDVDGAGDGTGAGTVSFEVTFRKWKI